MAVADTGPGFGGSDPARLDTARREIENYSKYDYVLVNNVLEQSADQLRDIVLAVRLQRSGPRFPRRQAASGSGASLPVEQAREGCSQSWLRLTCRW